MNKTKHNPDPPRKKEKHAKGPPPKFVIGVRRRGREKTEKYDPNGLVLKVGMQVMAETEGRPQLGTIASNKVLNVNRDPGFHPRKIVRVADERDLEKEQAKREREHKATVICRGLIDQLQLPMNLSRVVYFEEMNKSIFYFTAEGRVDFRELVKQLASRLRHRIEMRQVGVRDEAKSIGGHGICGESLCCSSFLPEFSPVTIRMAKDQGLALNPSKISGVCGRLMCCLQYEHENYRHLIKEMPRVGKTINTPDGRGKIVKIDILKQTVTVRPDAEFVMYYDLDELRDFLNPDPKAPTTPAR